MQRKAEEDKAKANCRGKKAIQKEKETIEIISNFDRDRRNVEKKQKVKQLETQISHALAEEFRLKEKERLELEILERQREEAKKIYAIDRYGNKVDNFINVGPSKESNISSAGWKADASIGSNTNKAIDYTNTCFHNALIVRHDTEDTQTTNNSKLLKSAFENAEDFKDDRQRAVINKREKKIKNEIIAQERGKAALDKLHIKPFEPEIKQVYEPNKTKLAKTSKQK